MIKYKLALLFILLSTISAAEDLRLKNGYSIFNVQLVDTLNGCVRYKGMDIIISLPPDQIRHHDNNVYDSCSQSSINFYAKGHNNGPRTAFNTKVITLHNEIIRGDLYQDTDSIAVFQTEYGMITIAKHLIMIPLFFNNNNMKSSKASTITMSNGESFDGKQISSTGSTKTYRSNIGDITLSNNEIEDISTPALDNRNLFLGSTFSITMINGESFDGTLISSTDTSQTFQTKSGTLTVPRRYIKRNILTICGDPLERSYLFLGNIFTNMMLDGTSFKGKLISSTNSTVTYQVNLDSVTILKNNIKIVFRATLDNGFLRSDRTNAVATVNKESFNGELISSTDSTKTYQTNTGDITILNKNIMAVDNTLEELMYSIKKPALFSIYSGIAIPMGEFAGSSNSQGGAQTGFSAGIQFITCDRIGVLLDACFSSNSMRSDALKDILTHNVQRKDTNVSIGNSSTSNWYNFLFQVGLKIGTKNLSGTNWFISPIVGVDLSISPNITGVVSGHYYTNNPGGIVDNTYTGSITQNSISSVAFVYGAIAEIVVSDRYTISARYVSGKSHYDLKYSDNSTGSFEQTVSLLQLCLGVVY